MATDKLFFGAIAVAAMYYFRSLVQGICKKYENNPMMLAAHCLKLSRSIAASIDGEPSLSMIIASHNRLWSVSIDGHCQPQ